MINEKVYIVLLNYNGYKDTIECLESIYKNAYENYSIIVCDNASIDESEEEILLWKKNNPDKVFKYIQTEKNLGFAGGNNIAIQYALQENADYVWLLNNDTTIETYALVNLVRKIKEKKNIGICGSRLMYYHDKDKVQGIGGTYSLITGKAKHIYNESDLCDLKYVVGASMLVSRDFLKNIGLMDESYFLYFEELDWAERGKKKYEIDVALDSVVYHKEGTSIKTGSNFSEFYLLRNRLKFAWKHHRKYFISVFLTTCLTIFHPWHKRPYRRMAMFCKVLKHLS